MAQAGGQEIFVSAAASKEIGGVLESHNALAQKLVELQQHLEALKQNHEEALKAAGEKQAKEEERQAADAQKQQEERRQLDEQISGLKAQLDDLGKSKGSSDEKLEALEESTATNVKSLQLAIDELGSHQAELKTRVLPKWEAELSSQIKKLEKDLLALRQGSEARSEKIEKTLAGQEEQLRAELAALEPRLRPLLDEAAARLDAAEANLNKLGIDMDGVAAAGKQRHDDLAAELRGSLDQLRDFVRDQDQAVLRAFTEEHGRRTQTLEGAVKQADFERLAFADRVTKELASVAEDLQKLSSCDECQEEETAKLRTLLEQKDKHYYAHLDKVVTEIRTQVTSCESNTSNVAQSCTVFEQRHDAGQSDILRRLEVEVKRLEDSLREQADVVVKVIRGDEGARLTALEEEVKELARQRQQLAARLEQEQKDRKAEVEGCVGGAEKRAAAVELVANARFESVRRALDELVLEFQGYVRTENTRSMDVARLEALVRALEVRVWPWRNGAKDRSPSPPKVPVPNAPPKYPNWSEETDWRDWIKTKRPERPATARSRRAEPKDPSAPNGLVGSPVGPAMTVVRSVRAPGAPGDRTDASP